VIPQTSLSILHPEKELVVLGLGHRGEVFIYKSEFDLWVREFL
jgi:hypothetical protein